DEVTPYPIPNAPSINWARNPTKAKTSRFRTGAPPHPRALRVPGRLGPWGTPAGAAASMGLSTAPVLVMVWPRGGLGSYWPEAGNHREPFVARLSRGSIPS